jgi:hypothetical protein
MLPAAGCPLPAVRDQMSHCVCFVRNYRLQDIQLSKIRGAMVCAALNSSQQRPPGEGWWRIPGSNR